MPTVLFRQPFRYGRFPLEPEGESGGFIKGAVPPWLGPLPDENPIWWLPIPLYPDSPRIVPPGYSPIYPEIDYKVSDFKAPPPSRKPKTAGGMNASMPPTDNVLADLFGRNAPDKSKCLATVFLEDESLSLYGVCDLRYILPQHVTTSEYLRAKAEALVVTYPTLEYPINAIMVMLVFHPGEQPSDDLEDTTVNLCITT